MRALKVRVQDGRITGDAPPGLPDGDLDLCLAEPEEEMSEEELARLNQVLEAGFEAIQAGRFRPAAEVIAELRARR
jgi:hypothetical protein